MNTVQNSFQTPDSVSLFYRVWTLDADSICDFVIFHGLLEHGGRYDHLPEALANLGIPGRYFVMDYRGHGRSGGTRGDIHDFESYIQDAKQFLNQIVLPEHKKLKGEGKRPLVIIAHSTGGLIMHLLFTGHYPSHEFKNYDGAIFSAPAYKISSHTPQWKTYISSILAKTPLAGLGVSTGLKSQDVTRDPNMIEKHKDDPLIVTKITPRLWMEFNDAMAMVRESPGEIYSPILFALPGDDHVISHEATLSVIEKFKAPILDKKIYADDQHEIFNEIDRAKVFSDCALWLKQNVL